MEAFKGWGTTCPPPWAGIRDSGKGPGPPIWTTSSGPNSTSWPRPCNNWTRPRYASSARRCSRIRRIRNRWSGHPSASRLAARAPNIRGQPSQRAAAKVLRAFHQSSLLISCLQHRSEEAHGVIFSLQRSIRVRPRTRQVTRFKRHSLRVGKQRGSIRLP